MRKRNKTNTKPVDIVEVKEDLVKRITEKYGSVNAFANSEDAKSIGVDVMANAVLTPNGRNSLVVINAILKLFKLPTITKKITVVRSVNYFTE